MRFPIRIAALLLAALPVWAQFGGPAILARGEAPAAMTGTPINFRPFVTFSGVYDTGLAAVAVTDQGQLATAASYGMAVSGGISGSKVWKRGFAGLDYRGNYTDYAHASQSRAYNQSLLFGLTYHLSKHISLAVNETAGLFTRDVGFAGLSQSVPFDPITSYVPTTDFFDNRTIYLTNQASLIYQKSLRLSFSISGGLFINRRLSSALYGAVGEVALGDVQYRVSRRQTIGVVYTYNHMGYTHVLGGTDVHGVSASYSIRPTRSLEFSGSAGFFRQEDKFLQSVAVDPIITALLGITQSVQIYHGVIFHPHFSGRLSHRVHNGVFYATAGNAVTPGNGLFLTSYATTAMGGYSYTGLRRWSINITGGKVWAQAYGNASGGYGNLTGSLSVARTLGRGMSATWNYSARQYSSPDFQKYNRLIYSVSIGIAFSPGNVPLRIW